MDERGRPAAFVEERRMVTLPVRGGMRRARGVRGGWWRGVGGMFRGLESGVWVQGVGDGGDGANLLDGAWMGFLRAGRTGRESGLGVGSVSVEPFLCWIG